jgi:hypothetical protein
MLIFRAKNGVAPAPRPVCPKPAGNATALSIAVIGLFRVLLAWSVAARQAYSLYFGNLEVNCLKLRLAGDILCNVNRALFRQKGGHFDQPLTGAQPCD